MPSQLTAVSNNLRLRRNQIAELNARQDRLPEIIANQQRQADLIRADEMKNLQIDQWDREHKFAKKARRAGDRASEVGLGLEAGKLGLSASRNYGGTTFGQLGSKAKNLFSSTSSTPGSSPGFWGNMTPGSLVSGGLAGFGASKIMGGKNKFKKAGMGLAAGSILGLLSGGSNPFSGAASGGIGGLIGGLFG
jgi:hypothetical protein